MIYLGVDPGASGAIVALDAAGPELDVYFSVATSEQWTDKGGTWQERTEWHGIRSFNPVSEVRP